MQARCVSGSHAKVAKIYASAFYTLILYDFLTLFVKKSNIIMMQKSFYLPGIAALLVIMVLAVLPSLLKASVNTEQLSGRDTEYHELLHAVPRCNLRGHIPPTYIASLPDRMVAFKIEQGITFGRILDQRMSNLHYSGPGAVLAFSRYAKSDDRISEIGFARGSFHYVKPKHEGTIVYNPGFGLRYMQLKRLKVDAFPDFYLGARIDLAGNARIAPVLSNSYLFADLAFEFQPKIRVAYPVNFFNRDWQVHGSAALTLFGYSLRLPEYGTIFQISEDGGSVTSRAVSGGLHPGNFTHLTTGAFLRTAIGGDYNPNWLRFGYVWDYVRTEDNHNLNTYHASHQFVLELYFMMN